MRILVIGSGGREHTLVWKLKQSREVEALFCAPGNAGIGSLATCVPIESTDIAALVQFAEAEAIDLTVVGPEIPLLAGIVDRFQEKGLSIFGPTEAAARLEGSKRFAKEIMQKYGIPTGKFRSFSDYRKALHYVNEVGAPIVIKADGLAAGKGVTVAQTLTEAEAALEMMMKEKAFGKAGHEVVIEEYLEGEEVSLMALVDGTHVVPLEPAQDHKPAFDGDQGPNTGGMGAYSPVPHLSHTIVDQAMTQILQPIAHALQQEGIHYRGILYAGLMITSTGPKVIEFNVRFGDPEAQVVLPRLQTELAPLLQAVSEGKLSEQALTWRKESALCVVMAAKGYPSSYAKGIQIKGNLEMSKQEMVFHAGTKKNETGLVSDGGRVLGITAFGRDIAQAKRNAYARLEQIQFAGAHYRTDIGDKATIVVERGVDR
ncbi:phosphoribosylamine--glycine ligase [Mechercharimyces sp. CAU 1602]|uniref:phosphoribosylamine--glycine ligase n=1 Tax=Mechercharimyces sp. CAU 1602 TaxID=2973933 RepID=UPI002161D465|nr:phosphoribosylamine--glycine ligase [Mechercharimyces sp. CAU 1602]MCS1352011.1 phosphoribosylamine--glycine ligase [Mechercharimyces sp. CAU 1602]